MCAPLQNADVPVWVFVDIVVPAVCVVVNLLFEAVQLHVEDLQGTQGTTRHLAIDEHVKVAGVSTQYHNIDNNEQQYGAYFANKQR